MRSSEQQALVVAGTGDVGVARPRLVGAHGPATRAGTPSLRRVILPPHEGVGIVRLETYVPRGTELTAMRATRAAAPGLRRVILPPHEGVGITSTDAVGARPLTHTPRGGGYRPLVRKS